MQRFRDKLARELEIRREANPRYSLRAFAKFLGADHSTLSQILRAARPIPAAQLRAWAKKLGLEPEEAAAWIAAEHLPDATALERERQLRHWSAEAAAIAGDSTHWRLMEFARTGQPPDTRRIADAIGVTPDQVNMAFSRLLGLRLIATAPNGAWIDITDPPVRTEREFLRAALSRVRSQAAAYSVKLPPIRSRTNAESRL